MTAAAHARTILAAVTASAVAVVVAAVAFNFFEASRARRPATERRSPVATGTMALFFVLLWALLRSRTGAVEVREPVATILAACGTALVVLGAAVNVAGRARLGGGWADHVKVYADHVLVTDGVFGIVRHPLYASLAWMGFGAAVELANPLAAAAVALVFVPMVVFRARQEERALAERFPDYARYRRHVGMLVPRLSRREAREDP